MRRGDFERLLRRHLDSELAPRGFRLTTVTVEMRPEWNEERPVALYEANPDDFGQRYPALDGRATGNDRCVDLWIHLDPSRGQITSELEGSSPEDLMARFRLKDPAAGEARPLDADSQLRLLARRIGAILDAASAPQ